jgi:cell surface protein SprA
MNELEEYFEYKVKLTPADLTNNVGKNFISDSRSFTANGVYQTWYQFRIPINSYEQKVGNIPDFKSVRYIRMFMTGFNDSLVCRFAEFQLIRDSWRNFNYELDTTGQYIPIPNNSLTNLDVTAVNIEQNSTRTPIPYVIPPGVERQQQLSTNNVNLLMNEQSMSLQICGLQSGDARGVYKNVSYDLRRYGKMEMYIHVESRGADTVKNNQIAAVIRLGSDFINNFYEVRLPLKITPWGSTLDTQIWPDSNNLSLILQRLVQLKEARNATGNTSGYYSVVDTTNQRVYSMFGNPNLGQIQAMFLGIQNISGSPKCVEAWFDELRLSNIDDQGGYAANGRVDIKIADFGTLYLSGAIKSVGFGTLDQSINERSLSKITQLDAATNLELGKLLPKKSGMSIPFYGSYSKTVSTPQYDPYDLDIKLADKVKAAPADERDSIEKEAIDVTTIRSFNFTNVRRNNITGKKLKLWSIENFDLTYSYTKTNHENPIALEDELTIYKGGLGYNFVGTPKYWEPLKKFIKSRSPWYSIFRDFNVNPVPSIITFRGDIVRQYGAYTSRNVGGGKYQIPTTYNKFFTIDRTYILRWDITRSLNIDFAALNKSWVDEDSGALTKQGKKQMWNNFWKGGRTISYSQTANFTYTVPTLKIPALDWTTLRLGYGSSYTWTGASTLATSYGNVIMNTQKKDVSADFNLTRLYSKWRLLRELDQQAQPPPPNLPGKKTDSLNQKKAPVDYTDGKHLTGIMKGLAKILTSVKDVTVNFSEVSASSIYGYTDSSHFLGQDLKSNEPGWGYIFGEQPDTGFVNRLGKKGLLSTDTLFNFQNQASYNQIINIAAQIQPTRDLNITVNVSKSFGKNYSELYKDTTGGNTFARLNPYTAGSFSISFISIKTLFTPSNSNQVSSTFQTFENYRSIISARLGAQNPYSGGQQTPDGYAKGYGKYAQDVLIPAFIAAYSGKSPDAVALVKEDNPNIKFNPFSGYLPKPNWRLTYNGLTRIPGMEKIFTNFSITDGYNSTLSMNSFNSNLNYQDPFGIRQPGFIDTLTGNFVPYFLVPNITISEQFAPLIDLDMQFVNQLQAKFSFSKSRQLSLSLIDYQMSESRSTEYVFGIGYRKRGVPLPFHIKIMGKNGFTNRLENDLTFRLDMSFRDDATTNSYLDQNAAVPVGGQQVISISPSIDYVVNNRINLKLYFDERRTVPKISSSPPVTTTRAGIQIRISLAEMAAQQPKK